MALLAGVDRADGNPAKAVPALHAGRDHLHLELEAGLLALQEPGQQRMCDETVTGLVVGDVPFAPGFASLIDEPPSAFAMALLFEQSKAGRSIGFEMPQSDDCAAVAGYEWPTALEFLRWMLSDEQQLDLQGARHAWRWLKR